MTYDPGQKRGWHYSHVIQDPKKIWNEANFWKRLKMRLGRRVVVVKTHEGPKLVSLAATTKHSHEIAAAPPGFHPGDEQFISLSQTGKVIFDHKAHALHHGHVLKERIEKADWNESTPLQRFRKKLKPKAK